jgi:hypothetical protein
VLERCCYCRPVGCWWSSLVVVHLSSPPHPPREQLLMAVVCGTLSLQSLSSGMGLIITLRAGARSGDMGVVLAPSHGYNIVRT